MSKTLLVLLGTGLVLSTSTAGARDYSNTIACSGWRNGQCVAWNRLTKEQAAKVQVGTVFGPNYTFYSDLSALPKTVVTQYSLTPENRYVTADGYVYVIDPHSYAVTKVITVPSQ